MLFKVAGNSIVKSAVRATGWAAVVEVRTLSAGGGGEGDGWGRGVQALPWLSVKELEAIPASVAGALT